MPIKERDQCHGPDKSHLPTLLLHPNLAPRLDDPLPLSILTEPVLPLFAVAADPLFGNPPPFDRHQDPGADPRTAIPIVNRRP